MKKIAVVLAVLMVMMTMTAYAETVAQAVIPSKTVTDVVKVEDPNSTIQPAKDTEETNAVLGELIQFAAANPEASAVEAFDETVQTEIAAVLPDVDIKALEMNEFISIAAIPAASAAAEEEVTFEFATTYAPEQKVTALVGVINGGQTTWYVQEAYVNDNGKVTVRFTQDVMEKMALASSVVLSILSTPAAA